MATGGPNGGGESLRDLAARLIDNAKAYAAAEIEVVKQTGLSYVRASRIGAALALLSVLLLLSALPVLVAALGMTLAIWIGAAAGLFVGALIAILVALLLAWLALRSFASIGDKVK